MFIRKYFEAIYHDTHDEKVVLLTGARQVGKTTLMRQIQDRLEQDGHETVWLSLEDPDILRVLDSHPRELLSLIGSRSEKIYVCIDEVQYLRDPSGFLKYHSDLSGDRVKIIATGSSAFYLDTKFHDSLAGRKWLHEILPLDFSEWLGITGQEHLVRDTLEVARNTSYMRSGEILRLYEEYILYGGYPGVAKLPTPLEKKNLLRLLVTDYTKKDALEGGVEKPEKYLLLMKLLAHQTGNLMNKNEISSRLSIDVRTLERYLYILSRSYHLRLVTPYSRHIRTELTRMPKIYFYDTGIRNMLMNSFEPLIIRADSGSLLENIVLSVLMHRHPTEDIHFWRTQGGQEIDFIIPDIHKAYEVKTDISRYSEKRYSTFLEKYPDIELVPIDMRLSMGDI